MNRPRVLALFDVDGTLIVAGDRAHHDAFVLAAAEVHGVTVDLDGIPLGGRLDHQITADALARAGLGPAVIAERRAELMATMGRHYRALVPPDGRRAHLLPGVVASLDACAAAGIACGVVTGGAASIVPWKLTAAGLLDRFGVLACGDEADDRADLIELARVRARIHWGADFDPAATVVVGDTPNDIAAARLAGTRVVAVATGRWSLTELAEHRPDGLLADLADPAAVLAALTDGREP